MKVGLTCFFGAVVAVAAGFIGGRAFERMKSGYHVNVLSKKVYESAVGRVEWSHISESFGAANLNPDTTMIKFEDRIVYKAQREFQETSPFVDDVTVSDNNVRWNDGEFQFSLTVEPANKGTNAVDRKP